ncbi:MAG: hypothetical protein EOP60_08765 [Sphingomonadales bacterium]|nr:MAG: hypothetical protein EOP60_08765 [Sphingomonadales bacterium]
MIFGMFAALAMGLGGLAVPDQDLDPLVAAAKIAESIAAPKEIEAGVWIRDARAEGPMVIIGIEIPPEAAGGELVGGFIEGMCGQEYKAAMNALFSAGMRVRPDMILAGKRSLGAVIDRCP